MNARAIPLQGPGAAVHGDYLAGKREENLLPLTEERGGGFSPGESGKRDPLGRVARGFLSHL